VGAGLEGPAISRALRNHQLGRIKALLTDLESP